MLSKSSNKVFAAKADAQKYGQTPQHIIRRAVEHGEMERLFDGLGPSFKHLVEKLSEVLDACKVVQVLDGSGKSRNAVVPDYKAQIEVVRILGRYLGLERREATPTTGPLGRISDTELLRLERELCGGNGLPEGMDVLPAPPRSLEEIESDIRALEKDISVMLREVVS